MDDIKTLSAAKNLLQQSMFRAFNSLPVTKPLIYDAAILAAQTYLQANIDDFPDGYRGTSEHAIEIIKEGISNNEQKEGNNGKE